MTSPFYNDGNAVIYHGNTRPLLADLMREGVIDDYCAMAVQRLGQEVMAA